MLSITEWTLQALQEECAEIIYAASKCNRFGIHDDYRGPDQTPRKDLVREINDLSGTVEFLLEQGVELPELYNRDMVRAKKEKLRTMLAYAIEKGRVDASL